MIKTHGFTLLRNPAEAGAPSHEDGVSEPAADEAPLRAELFSVEQLERHARTLAQSHHLGPAGGRDRLLPRLRQNEQALTSAHALIGAAAKDNRGISPAAEWLLDNFYLIEEQIRMARRHLPQSYSRQLPIVSTGPMAGYPRVYDIALELISHVDGRIDAGGLGAFTIAYQSVAQLRLGELWAIPIMLRLALIENLRRVAVRIADSRRHRDQAAHWAERMIQTVEKNPTDLIVVVADMVRNRPPLTSAFVAELTRQLQGQSPQLGLAINWLEQRVAEQGFTVQQMVRSDSQAQAADQVSIGNSINSLRFLGSMDWREFVESMSAVEQILRRDPAGVYPTMDFETRDQYRHVIEQIARFSRSSEAEVAQAGIRLASAAPTGAADGAGEAVRPVNHVGFYLLGAARRRLERSVAMRVPPWMLIRRLARAAPLMPYLGGIIVITAAIVAAVWALARDAEVRPAAIGLLALPVILGASQVAVGIVNWLVTMLVAPRRLPRLNFAAGIPDQWRTLVAIPCMLSSPAAIDELLEELELRYLTNRSPNLHFALLSDFKDAASETTPEDQQLLDAVRGGIENLARKYDSDRNDLFYLLHRPRRWNPMQGVWMGEERKRGKLGDLNSLIRGGPAGPFSATVGDLGILKSVRLVITLDADTGLPRDAASQMAGSMAHPLNRPVFDPRTGLIVEGYGILQPRTAVNLPSALRSWFTRLYAGEPGIDPYTRVVSDVYQDLFDEGSYIGKGIYDVVAFERTCTRFPDNTILSHDLLEGCHARSGLISDVTLFEDHPSIYNVDVSRRHRWTRGDWQILHWLFGQVPAVDGQRVSNTISWVSRWKILDNLRRSLVPAAVTFILLGAWLLTTGRMAVGLSVFAVACLAVPAVLAAISGAMRLPRNELPPGLLAGTLARESAVQAARLVLAVALLPYEAYIAVDAVVRTLIRMGWTRRRLLEWQTARAAERASANQLLTQFRSMWISPALAVVLAVALLWRRHEAGGGAAAVIASSLPILALWFISPSLGWLISQPIKSPSQRVSPEQRQFLRRVARLTWRFFETFDSEKTRYLVPDNFQEYPHPMVAPRTSPTNIGMALISNLAAVDLGYLSIDRLCDRVERTLRSMERLERFRTHFFNWYDLDTGKPLNPRYVSSVDSGNLMGMLRILRAGLLEMTNRPLTRAVFDGITDTLEIYRATLDGHGGTIGARQEIHRELQSFSTDVALAPPALSAALRCLDRLVDSAVRIRSLTEAATEDAELRYWAAALEDLCRAHRDPLRDLVPQDGEAGGPGAAAPADVASTLRQIAALADRAESNGDPDAHGSTDPARQASVRIARLTQLAQMCGEMSEMDFSFLYDTSRKLFSIGYNVTDHRMDASQYDLLASESRLGSFVAIAEGQVPQEHWFAMGRLLTRSGGAAALLSWSGSMFEYFMPLLVMPTYPGTLLDETYRAVLNRQMAYGRQRGTPWGVSESGYNATDRLFQYQYRPFGVPGLGLKRGLAEDLVIAPYATVLGLMAGPVDACLNLQRLRDDGRLGRYGFFEAIDYTPARLPPGQSSITVRSFMAHHQGMSLLALDYHLLDQPMQRRFESDPMLRANELLLQERVPRLAPVYPHAPEVSGSRSSPGAADNLRVIKNPGGGTPQVHLLSNGNYHVMVSSAGGGYSRWHDVAVTRWRQDPTRDCWGMFFYIRDLETGRYWSSTFQPTLHPSPQFEAVFSQARAEFRRRDEGIAAYTEISVSPEDDVELRRLTLSNHSTRTRTLEVTTFAEVALVSQAADETHPAFNKLFVQTELGRDHNVILCTRRPRSKGDPPPWMVHQLSVEGSAIGGASFETDRLKFLGRGRTTAAPQAMDRVGQLSNTQGPVLDPIVSVRRIVRLEPDESVRLDAITGMSPTRQGALALAEKYHDARLADRVFELALTHSQVVLRHLNVSETEAQNYARLASSIIYPARHSRAPASIVAQNRRSQAALWAFGLSGDLPIVLVRIHDQTEMELVRQSLAAHAYWRNKGLTVDLVIWNEDDSVYRQALHDAIVNLVASGPSSGLTDKAGGVFVRRREHMSEDDRIVLQAAASVVLSQDAGTLGDQAARRAHSELRVPLLRTTLRRQADITRLAVSPRRELAFFNGFGGFTPDGREYVVLMDGTPPTPMPWSNVIANAEFGTVLSESGLGYTWSENAHELRLSPWQNDPISDPAGEAIYIRDEETGQFWSPTPLPARGDGSYATRHGFGYTVFEHAQDGIASELTAFVALDAPVKVMRLRLRNQSGRVRRLSASMYVEWVLAELRRHSIMHVITEIDPQTEALFARNPFSIEFPGRVAFLSCSEAVRSVTGNRSEFIGRNGTLNSPAALRATRLTGTVGAGFDPCGAVMAQIEIADGQQRDIVFCLGAATNDEEARRLVREFTGTGPSYAALEAVWRYWNDTLGAVYVETPDKAVNFLVNGWLPYQTLCCRMWARSGYYQSGGAFGFRDQLQDAMILVHAQPKLLRDHLLRAAAKQFREGDVLHWWHPPQGRGVRTHFSDDFLWLPYAVCRYVQSVGDTGVLDEVVPFIQGRPLRPDEESNYDLPQVSDETAPLYEHCVRAIKNALRVGSHGLPLIGCGDWNDGMNLVGVAGKGESVWLAFFLYDLLMQFSDLARRRGDVAFADQCIAHAGLLRQNVEQNAWDGQWYRRAYFDDGQPLGSSINPECQIDSLSQSWAVLSRAADSQRARGAMDQVYDRLVRHDARLIELLTPPFDRSDLEPGYIKGYIPGVRENGGQYTHAAVWTIMAMAEMGDARRAWELLDLINPVNHAKTFGDAETYKAEPYVVAADVYSNPVHLGRGGWTWYTGSSGWLYRAVTESLLGLRLEVNALRFRPCLPADWKSFKLHYRYRETFFHVTVTSGGGGTVVGRVVVDGVEQADKLIHLVDDRQPHNAEVFVD